MIFAAGLLLFVTLLSLVQNLSYWILTEFIGEKMLLRFRGKLFQKAQQLSLAYHETRGISDITYRLQNDASTIQRLIIWGVIPFIISIFTLFGMIFVIMKISPKLALIALAVAPIIILFTSLYTKRLQLQWERVKERETSALSVIQEVFGAIRLVKSFRQENYELNRFLYISGKGLWDRIRIIFNESYLTLLIGLTTGIGTGTVVHAESNSSGGL